MFLALAVTLQMTLSRSGWKTGILRRVEEEEAEFPQFLKWLIPGFPEEPA